MIHLDLHGDRAPRGIDIDSLEKFLQAFRAALRDHERSRSRAGQIGRGGTPDARDAAATALRLTGLKTGSALLTLEEPSTHEDGLPLTVPGLATENLTSMLEGLERQDLAPQVVDALDDARKALGRDGHFGVQPEGTRRVTVNDRVIKKLRDSTSRAADTPQSVFGHLHAVETEKPLRVEIRSADGTNWTCSFPAELEDAIVGLLRSTVLAHGSGRRLANARGTLRIEHIEGVIAHQQSPLFTTDPIPSSELVRSQRIHGPQGLDAFSLAGDVTEDEAAAFLAAILDD